MFLLTSEIGVANQRDRSQSPEQWRRSTLKKFTPPQVSLKNYGGDFLHIISQTPLTLSQGDYSVEATVLVQKGAPHDLLLGTDVLQKHGFALLLTTPKKTVDLLAEEESSTGHRIVVPRRDVRDNVPTSWSCVSETPHLVDATAAKPVCNHHVIQTQQGDQWARASE